MLNTLMQASHEWATRPADERYLSLTEMGDKARALRARSAGKVVSSRSLKVIAPGVASGDHKSLMLQGPGGNAVAPTNWSFGQLATLAGTPAGYMKKLPAPLAADCLNYGLHVDRDIEDVGVLLQGGLNGDAGRLMAATGPNYGRIWNGDVVDALESRVGNGVDGDWRVPGEFGKAVAITRDNTTFYLSDRDMFVFLADEKNRIEVPNRRDGKSGSMARGFFVWNSEVGAATLGAAFFMFDYVCCNRIVWGVEGFKEMRLRHTVSAPDKWLRDITPVLTEYANSAASPIEASIKAAQARKVDDLAAFMASRQFGKKEALQIAATHEREEGRPMESLWDIATGVTAFARGIEYQDERIGYERAAGKILELAVA